MQTFGVNNMSERAKFKKWLWIAVVGWFLLVCVSFVFNSWQSWQSMLEQGRNEGKMAFLKDLSCRSWNAGHGAVYVPVTESTQPDPYLHLPHRDVTTTDGQKLTLLTNFSYMAREVFTQSAKYYVIRGHITCAFEKNSAEITEFLWKDGKPFIRFMRPLITKNVCLKCHAKQGYKLGDIRGGISESVPMSNLISKAKETIWYLALAHGVFLLVGILGVKWGYRKITQYL